MLRVIQKRRHFPAELEGLRGKVNSDPFLGFGPGCLRFEGFRHSPRGWLTSFFSIDVSGLADWDLIPVSIEVFDEDVPKWAIVCLGHRAPFLKPFKGRKVVRYVFPIKLNHPW